MSKSVQKQQSRAGGLSVGDEAVVEIERAGGDGVCVARHEGQVVFVRDVLPGEQVRVRVTSIGRKGRFVRAELTELLQVSDHRVEPPCNLARECGGCDWQHADLAYQREFKRDILLENLRKFGDLVPGSGSVQHSAAELAAPQPLSDSDASTIEYQSTGANERVPAESTALAEFTVEALPDAPGALPGLGYRTRMRFAIDDHGDVGLRAARSHRIIPAADCLLPVPEISEVVPDQVTNFGDERALVAVASNELSEEADVELDASPVDLDADLASANDRDPNSELPMPVSESPEDGPRNPADQAQDEQVHAGSDNSIGLATDMSLDELHAEFGGADTHRPVTAQVRARTFEVDLNGFWQVHRAAPETLVDAVLGFAQVQPGETIFDLYCGVGLFTAFLAESTGENGVVHAIEGDLEAIEYAKQNLDDLPWVTMTAADVADLDRFTESPNHFVHPAASDSARIQPVRADLVVTDPPRAGLGQEVVQSITDLEPSRIIYVSCDSATFARDLKTFADRGYRLDQLRAFDLFPMTKHLETVARLVPTN